MAVANKNSLLLNRKVIENDSNTRISIGDTINLLKWTLECLLIEGTRKAVECFCVVVVAASPRCSDQPPLKLAFVRCRTQLLPDKSIKLNGRKL